MLNSKFNNKEIAWAGDVAQREGTCLACMRLGEREQRRQEREETGEREREGEAGWRGKERGETVLSLLIFFKK